jgi:hypothetical protein
MSTSEREQLCRAIVEELKTLARDRGVQRDDKQLVSLLQDRLPLLCSAWGIDPAKGATAAKAVIKARLNEHLATMRLPERQPQERSGYRKLVGAARLTQFCRVVHVVFNTDTDLAAGLADTDIRNRLDWLASPANRDLETRADYSLHRSAAERDYTYARNEIAEILANRLAADSASLSEDQNTLGSDNGQLAVQMSHQSHDSGITAHTQPLPARPHSKRRSLLIGAMVIVLLGGSVAAFYINEDGNTAAKGLPSTPSASVSASQTAGAAGISVVDTAAPYGPITVLPQYGDGQDAFWLLPQAMGPSDQNRINALGLDFNSWVPAMRGVMFYQGTYELTITGSDPDGVTITNMTIDILQKKPSLQGSAIVVSGQGDALIQDATFNLDTDPTVGFAPGELPGQVSDTPYFANHTVNLAKNEPITFDVNLQAVKYDYLFDVVFTMDVQGKLEKYTVAGPGGQPFQINGEDKSYDAVFESDENAAQYMQYESSQVYCSFSGNACIGAS